MAWIGQGWLDYQERGLNPPAAVLAATKKYEHDSDILARFLADESAVVQGHGQTSSAVLYKKFQDWARSEGEPTEMSNKAFPEALQKRGFGKTKQGAMWQSISLAAEDSDDDHSGDRGGW